jgi:hypothetical protein
MKHSRKNDHSLPQIEMSVTTWEAERSKFYRPSALRKTRLDSFRKFIVHCLLFQTQR